MSDGEGHFMRFGISKYARDLHKEQLDHVIGPRCILVPSTHHRGRDASLPMQIQRRTGFCK
jgi:hypothetical protein